MIAENTTAFLSRWDTTQPGSANNQIVLPIYSGGIYNFTIDWGDGTVSNITSYTQNFHTYISTGVYNVNITGIVIGWRFNCGGDRLKLLEIKQWGCLRLGNLGNYFYGCANLNLTAIDILDLNETTSLKFAFAGCDNLGNNGNMNNWDVSKVTDMEGMFLGALTFNQSIDNWNVSRVSNMVSMFGYASDFNQPIGTWDMSSVTNTYNMFQSATSFYQPIGSWNISKVTNMGEMFMRASSFNQSLETWNVEKVIDMGYMFYETSSFNQPIGNWNIFKVTNMRYMFFNATSFNQPLGTWNVSSVTDMEGMFSEITLSVINYNNILIGWSQLSLQSNIHFDAGNSKYSDLSINARSILVNNFGWSIHDLGLFHCPSWITNNQTIYNDWILLEWNPVTSVPTYNIYLNGELNKSTSSNQYKMIFNKESTFFISVKAVWNGLESVSSSILTITTKIIPEIPKWITINQTISQNNIIVQWNFVTNATSYNLYVNGKLNATLFTTQQKLLFDQEGVYYITVKAVRNGYESLASEIIEIRFNVSNTTNLVDNNSPTTKKNHAILLIITFLVICGIYFIFRNQGMPELKQKNENHHSSKNNEEKFNPLLEKLRPLIEDTLENVQGQITDKTSEVLQPLISQIKHKIEPQIYQIIPKNPITTKIIDKNLERFIEKSLEKFVDKMFENVSDKIEEKIQKFTEIKEISPHNNELMTIRDQSTSLQIFDSITNPTLYSQDKILNNASISFEIPQISSDKLIKSQEEMILLTKFREIKEIATRIRLDRVASLLKISEDELFEYLIQWKSQEVYYIEGEEIIFDAKL